MSVNNHLLGISAFTLYVGATPAGQARSMIVSNHGPVNLFVGTGGTVGGILLQPGAALTVGLGTGATVTVYDAVGTGVWSTILFE